MDIFVNGMDREDAVDMMIGIDLGLGEQLLNEPVVSGVDAATALKLTREEADLVVGHGECLGGFMPGELSYATGLDVADNVVQKELGYPDGNPKTLMGAKKPDLSVVPPTALLHLATAMMNGAAKYGPYNFRDNPVSARTYIAAGMRHLLSYLDGEDFSADTMEAGAPVHHLAHVMACCAILLDTTECGTLNDNRPNVPGPTGEMIEFFNENGWLGAPCHCANGETLH